MGIGELRVQLKKIWERALDYLYPRHCFGCQREGEWLCQRCASECPEPPLQRCVGCNEVMPFGATCPDCLAKRQPPSLDGLTVGGQYRAWVWKPLIHTWKYRSAVELGVVASQKVTALAADFIPKISWTAVVPVPLTAKRERARGFNQSDILAEALALELHIPSRSFLKRVRETRSQARLTPKERAENMQGVFGCEAVEPGNYLLIDDVITTGATLNAAAAALKKAGATTVWGVSLVRSNPTDW